jgi:hypothetical protein
VSSTIDDLLARAAVPTTPPAAFDVGAALRRMAADAAKATPPPSDMQRAAEAGRRLAVVSRWILNEPSAADHVDRLADDQPTTLMDASRPMKRAMRAVL